MYLNKRNHLKNHLVQLRHPILIWLLTLNHFVMVHLYAAYCYVIMWLHFVLMSCIN
jgi:hypothetical protein